MGVIFLRFLGVTLTVFSNKTESPSDFSTLREKIIEKIKAYIQSQKTTEKLLANPLSETDGLQPYELSLLAFIVGEQCTDEEVAPIYELKNMMNKAGFNNTAFSIGIRLLKAKGFITTKVDSDFNGNEYTVCSLSNTGVDFVLKNTHLFELQQPSAQKTINTFSSDDLPF